MPSPSVKLPADARPRNTRWSHACVIAGTLLFLVAPSGWAAQSGDGKANRARGAGPDALYHDYCSVCHGDRGDGRSRARASLVPPPRDFTEPRLAATLSRDAMIAITRDGKPGTAMVGWKTQLQDADIVAVVDYIRANFMRATPVPAAAPPAAASQPRSGTARADLSLPLPYGLKGDAARGARFYAANCATCHGAHGDGQGPRAYFIRPRPRNFLDAPARASLNRPALYAGIALGRPGTEMPAWKTVIDDQQIADVSEYVFNAFIQSAAARGTERAR